MPPRTDPVYLVVNDHDYQMRFNDERPNPIIMIQQKDRQQERNQEQNRVNKRSMHEWDNCLLNE